MEAARSTAQRRRRAWLPWVLLAGGGVVAAGGGLMASRSITALTARNTQLEQQTVESEARVAELQVLRASMERRLRLLEQQHTGITAQREGEARRSQEADAQLARRESARQGLEVKLKEELARGDAWLDTSRPESLRVELSERLLFEPGQSSLTPQGLEVLGRVGAVLASARGHEVRVSSHTDELPTTGAGSAWTSWELSSARATAITRSLVEAPVRMAPERLSAIGHGSFRPAVPSDSPQNRLRNRRVELALSPMPLLPAALLATLEPTPPPRHAKKPASGGSKSRKKSSPR